MHTDPPDLDAKFEQWLLDSARRDTPPPELTERAWARFAKTSGHIAAGATGVLLSRLGLRAARSKWSWLGAGMLAGSALTVAVLTPREAPMPHGQREAPMPQVLREEAPATTVHAGADNEPREPEEPDERREPKAEAPPTNHGATAAAPRATPPVRPQPAAREALKNRRMPAALSPPAPSSSLAAEVRALDAVREEIESGNPERALAAVRDFHRDFPRAQLAADAEGLAIEALVARGDRDGAAQRARQFLRHYPEDPHAARFEPIARER